MNALPWTIVFSFTGAALALVAGTHSAALARRVGLVTALAGLAAALLAAARFTPGPGPVSYTHLTLPTNREV